MPGIEEIQKTVYRDSRGIEHLFKKDAQLAEIGYALQETTDEPVPAGEYLTELLRRIPNEYYPLIQEQMNIEEIALRRESLPEKIVEFYHRVAGRISTYTLLQILDVIAKELEDEGYILIRKR